MVINLLFPRRDLIHQIVFRRGAWQYAHDKYLQRIYWKTVQTLQGIEPLLCVFTTVVTT